MGLTWFAVAEMERVRGMGRFTLRFLLESGHFSPFMYVNTGYMEHLGDIGFGFWVVLFVLCMQDD